MPVCRSSFWWGITIYRIRLARHTPWKFLRRLGLPGVTVIGRPGLHLIETAVGRIQVVGLPYITRSFLLSREEYKDQPIEEINRILVEKAEEILRQFATQIDPVLPAILTVHGSVANAVLSSEQSIMMVGHDPIIPLSALTNPAWDYVALGHIHRHQDLRKGHSLPSSTLAVSSASISARNVKTRGLSGPRWRKATPPMNSFRDQRGALSPYGSIRSRVIDYNYWIRHWLSATSRMLSSA